MFHLVALLESPISCYILELQIPINFTGVIRLDLSLTLLRQVSSPEEGSEFFWFYGLPLPMGKISSHFPRTVGDDGGLFSWGDSFTL